MKFEKKDILYAVIGFAFFATLVAHCNQAEAGPYYADVGFGFTKDENVFCRDEKNNLGTYGIIILGINIDESLRIQYRHNSCVDKEHDEGSLDGIEIIFRFQ